MDRNQNAVSMSERGRRCGAGASTAELEEQREEEVEEVEEVEEQQQQQQKACRWLLLTTANLYTSAIERTIAPCTRGSWIACWSPDDGSVLQQKVLSLKGVDFRWVFVSSSTATSACARSLCSFVRQGPGPAKPGCGRACLPEQGSRRVLDGGLGVY